MTKISEIIASEELEQLFFVFFNLNKETDEGFQIRVNYRQSTKATQPLTEELAELNNDLLEDYFKLPFQKTGASTHTLNLENDTSFDRKEILNRIYSKTQQLRFKYDEDTYEKIMLMSLFAPRGSMDLNRNYFAVDILAINVSTSYVANLTSLLSSTRAIRQLNLNFRELQPEYVAGVQRRNTQVRINLSYFYRYYINELSHINRYKALILQENHDLIMTNHFSTRLGDSFIERAVFYRENIVGETTIPSLSTQRQRELIESYREELAFDETGEPSETGRNSDIVKLAIISQDDECVCCKDDYDIMDRTFMMANSERPYLEIHHVISFGADKNSDVLENLVKVCPACHRALTPGRAKEDYQKKLIENILKNSPTAATYIDEMFNESVTQEEKINYVYDHLR